MDKARRGSSAGAGPLSRRDILGLLGGGTAACLSGRLRAQSLPGAESAPALPACIVKPQQTEGPYFVDGALQRADLRQDPSDGSQRPGVPLELILRVMDLSTGSCRPLQGAVVDVWQNDALGEYSDVRDRLYDNRGKRFLRGHQFTDADGLVRFISIYPGWYPGRSVHVHFKIRGEPEAGRGREFTSQLYFDDALTDQVHQREPYAGKGQRRTRNENDRIFQQGGSALLLDLSPAGDGYRGLFELGLEA